VTDLIWFDTAFCNIQFNLIWFESCFTVDNLIWLEEMVEDLWFIWFVLKYVWQQADLFWFDLKISFLLMIWFNFQKGDLNAPMQPPKYFHVNMNTSEVPNYLILHAWRGHLLSDPQISYSPQLEVNVFGTTLMGNPKLMFSKQVFCVLIRKICCRAGWWLNLFMMHCITKFDDMRNIALNSVSFWWWIQHVFNFLVIFRTTSSLNYMQF